MVQRLPLFGLPLREINSALSKETDMFEKFMKRLDPKDVQTKGEQEEEPNMSDSLL